MKVVIPMAGRGTRFPHVDLPKPLIPLLGKPMVQWSIESIQYSFPDLKPSDFIFVTLREHEEKYGISKELEKIIDPGFTLHIIDDVTDGPVATVLTLEHILDPNEDFFTCDCDQYFRCPDLASTIKAAQNNNWAGLIPTYESDNPAYSYIKLDANGNATETAEKKVISSHTAIGIYYFGKSSIFIEAAKKMIHDDLRTKNEFYMCPLYNLIIQDGGVVRIVQTPEWMTLGTPDEAARFIEYMKKKHHEAT